MDEKTDGLDLTPLISGIDVHPHHADKLKGFATVRFFNDHFVLRNVKIVQSTRRLFVAMPAEKKPDGGYKDIFFPTNREAREALEGMILDAYWKAVEDRDRDIG